MPAAPGLEQLLRIAAGAKEPPGVVDVQCVPMPIGELPGTIAGVHRCGDAGQFCGLQRIGGPRSGQSVLDQSKLPLGVSIELVHAVKAGGLPCQRDAEGDGPLVHVRRQGLSVVGDEVLGDPDSALLFDAHDGQAGLGGVKERDGLACSRAGGGERLRSCGHAAAREYSRGGHPNASFPRSVSDQLPCGGGVCRATSPRRI